jgi:hypothetical protein
MTDMTADVAAAGKVTRLPLDYPALRAWWICFGISLALLLLFFISAGVLLTFGVGVWGNNIPVNWGLSACTRRQRTPSDDRKEKKRRGEAETDIGRWSKNMRQGLPPRRLRRKTLEKLRSHLSQP